MAALRVGFFTDSFDPVTSGQIGGCLSALSAGLDRVDLVLADSSPPGIAPVKDRWRMLAAACAVSKALVPVLLPAKVSASAPEEVRRFLSDRFPGEEWIPLAAPVFSGASSGLCPAVREYCAVKRLYGFSSPLPDAARWVDRLFGDLNPHRFAHSLSVALTAKCLAARFGEDENRAEAAGLLHDCAKCLPLGKMQKVAREHKLTEDSTVLDSGALLHSLVGARLAKKAYGMKDPAVLEAIMYHNTGFPGMSRLSMCICLADFIEPNRESFPLLEEVRRLAGSSLEKALLLSLEGTAEHVRSKGKYLHPQTLNTITWLKSLGENP